VLPVNIRVACRQHAAHSIQANDSHWRGDQPVGHTNAGFIGRDDHLSTGHSVCLRVCVMHAIGSHPAAHTHGYRSVDQAAHSPRVVTAVAKTRATPTSMPRPVHPPLPHVVRKGIRLKHPAIVPVIHPLIVRQTDQLRLSPLARVHHAIDRVLPARETQTTVVLTPVINDLLEHQPGDVPFSTHLELENARSRLIMRAWALANQPAHHREHLDTCESPCVEDTPDLVRTQDDPQKHPSGFVDARAMHKARALAEKHQQMATDNAILQDARSPLGSVIDLLM